MIILLLREPTEASPERSAPSGQASGGGPSGGRPSSSWLLPVLCLQRRRLSATEPRSRRAPAGRPPIDAAIKPWSEEWPQPNSLGVLPEPLSRQSTGRVVRLPMPGRQFAVRYRLRDVVALPRANQLLGRVMLPVA